MAVSKINSDSPSEYTISTSDFIVKLRKNLDGVALAHDDIDNNFEVLRRTINNLHTVIDEITGGELNSVASANIFVNKITDASISENKIADSSITTSKIQDKSITSAKLADNMQFPGSSRETRAQHQLSHLVMGY